MAAFSYQHTPLFLDPVILPNITEPLKNMNNSMYWFYDEAGSFNTSCFSQVYPPETFHETPLDVRFHEISDNETSLTKKQSTDSSTVVDKLESGEQVTQKVTPVDRKRKTTNGSSNSAQSKVGSHQQSSLLTAVQILSRVHDFFPHFIIFVCMAHLVTGC